MKKPNPNQILDDGSMNHEQELNNYKKRIAHILESFTDAFFEVSADWTILYWNKEAERLLDMPREIAVGQNLWQLYPEAVGLKFYTEYHRAIKMKTAVRFEEYYPPKEVWLEVSAFPDGNGLSIYFKNITERVNHLQAIEKQNLKLKEIAWIQAHKVRGPLSNIMGLAFLLDDQNLDIAQIKEIASKMKISAQQLDCVIKQIIEKG